MDDSFPLALIAFGLQFCIVIGSLGVLKCRVERIEKAKCRCYSQAHPLLDPVNI